MVSENSHFDIFRHAIVGIGAILFNNKSCAQNKLVLGGAKDLGNITNINQFDGLDSGIYYGHATSQCVGSPAQDDGIMVYFIKDMPNGPLTHRLFQSWRGYVYTGYPWTQINYGTTSLADLASALGGSTGVRCETVSITNTNKAANRAAFQTWFENAPSYTSFVLNVMVGATMVGVGVKHNNDNGAFMFFSYWGENLGTKAILSGGTWTWTD